jgi:hypothetical protein
MTTVLFTYEENANIKHGLFVHDEILPPRGNYLMDLVWYHLTYAKQHTNILFHQFVPVSPPFDWTERLQTSDFAGIMEKNQCRYYEKGRELKKFE